MRIVLGGGGRAFAFLFLYWHVRKTSSDTLTHQPHPHRHVCKAIHLFTSTGSAPHPKKSKPKSHAIDTLNKYQQVINQASNLHSTLSITHPDLNKPRPPCRNQTRHHQRSNNPNNPKEPPQPLRASPGNRHIHAEQPTNQIQRHQYTRQQRDLAQHLIRAVALGNVIHAQLGEVVAMAAGQHFLKVAEVGHHGHNVVLDVAEVEPDFAAGGDGILVVAAFGEAFDDVGFSAEEAHEGHDFLAALADLAEERSEVVGAGDKDLVFDDVGFDFDARDDRAKSVDNVVNHGITDPVGRQGHVVS